MHLQNHELDRLERNCYLYNTGRFKRATAETIFSYLPFEKGEERRAYARENAIKTHISLRFTNAVRNLKVCKDEGYLNIIEFVDDDNIPEPFSCWDTSAHD